MSFDQTQLNSFDGLPDHLVELVFNKLHDAKSLALSMCVNKRFNSIIPEVNSVFLSIPTPKFPKKSHDEKMSLLKKMVVKPLNFILGLLKSSSSSSSSQKASSSSSSVVTDSCNILPYRALKPFKSLRNLEIKIPKSNLEMKGSDLLRWRAEFGRQIKSCVLVGATSIIDSSFSNETEQVLDHQNVVVDTNEEGFKLRIVWSLSCLIAASARHVMAKKILKDHDFIEDLVIKDDDDQGSVSMNKEQIQELMKTMNKEDILLAKRTQVPTLRMKMWYVPELELPESGKVMKGATLVVIKPLVGAKKSEECGGNWVAEAFEGEDAIVFKEAIRELTKKEKSCVLEINSF